MLFIVRNDFLRFYLHAWSDFLQTGDDDAIARFQPFGDQPFITNSLSGGNLANFDFITFADDHRAGIAARGAGYALLRNQQRIRVDAFFQTRADEHPRQQSVIRVRENGAQRDRTGGLINGDVRKLQRTVLRVFQTVVRHQLNLRFTVFLLQLAVGQLLFQTQEIVARLRHVNIDRIQLLHGRQGGGLAVLHQSTFRDRGFTNAA